MKTGLSPPAKYFTDRSNVSKGAKIRNRYNQVPHLTQDTNGKVTNSQLDTTNKSQEASPFPAHRVASTLELATNFIDYKQMAGMTTVRKSCY